MRIVLLLLGGWLVTVAAVAAEGSGPSTAERILEDARTAEEAIVKAFDARRKELLRGEETDEKWQDEELAQGKKAKLDPRELQVARHLVLQERNRRRDAARASALLAASCLSESLESLERWTERALRTRARHPGPPALTCTQLDAVLRAEATRRQGYTSLGALQHKPTEIDREKFARYDGKNVLSGIEVVGVGYDRPALLRIFDEYWDVTFRKKFSADFGIGEDGAVTYRGSKVRILYWTKDGERTTPLNDKEWLAERDKELRAVAREVLVDVPNVERMRRLLRDSLPPDKEPKLVAPVVVGSRTETVEVKRDELSLADRFGRPFLRRPIELLDWDGFLANPAIAIRVYLSPQVARPAIVQLRTDSSRLYFDRPTRTDQKGSVRAVVFGAGVEDATVWLAAWPDRATASREYSIRGSYWSVDETPTDALALSVPGDAKSFDWKVRVEDHDVEAKLPPGPTVAPASYFPYVKSPSEEVPLVAPWPYAPKVVEPEKNAPFSVTIDFSQDKSGFFTDVSRGAKKAQRVVRRAADDFGYFLDELSLDPIEKGSETTDLRRTGKIDEADGQKVRNRYTYRDFLLYVSGSTAQSAPEGFGGARGSGFHAVRGEPLKLRRSGQLLIEGVDGEPGFMVSENDEEWWRAIYADDEPLDLYTCAIHEIEHALFAHARYSVFRDWSGAGAVDEGEVVAYQGVPPKLNGRTAHFEEKELDRASQRGAFGVPLGRMLQRRWLLTKLDLLLARAAGYKLRDVDSLRELTVPTVPVQKVKAGERLSLRALTASGGVPPYSFQVASGGLPEGIELDSFTGALSGVAKTPGMYLALVRVDESGEAHRTRHRVLLLDVE